MSNDWGKHKQVENTVFMDGKCVNMYTFADPETNNLAIKIINIEGLCVITGDLGNWIFDRCFHPIAGESVNVPYWLKKLRQNSTQQPCDFDTKETIRQIDEKVKEIEETEHRLQLDKLLYYNDCKMESDNEVTYMAAAINIPECMNNEDIVVGKILNPQLACIFDAFNEMCNRMKPEILTGKTLV